MKNGYKLLTEVASLLWLAAFWLAMFPPATSAQTAPAVHADASLHTYDLHLTWITPTDVMHKMHWDQQPASLPGGVQQLSADRIHNLLHIVATPQGYTTLRSMVNYLDVADRSAGNVETQLSISMALATQGQLGQADPAFTSLPWPASQSPDERIFAASLVDAVTGESATDLLTHLLKQSVVFASLTMLLAKNAPAAICVPMPDGETLGMSLFMHGTQGGDATLTFAPDFRWLHPTKPNSIAPMPPTVQPIHYDAETVYIFRRFMPASSETYLLVFVKPTIMIVK